MAEQDRTAVRVHPVTGRKLFNTPLPEHPNGSTVTDTRSSTTPSSRRSPAFKVDAAFTVEAKARYRDFNEVRRGSADYMAMDGQFARYLEDHYSAPPVEREALTDECEILVVGAGFAGLLLWYKLSNAGFDDIRFCEKGGDVGGTWYWNRYPGIACDVESYSLPPAARGDGVLPDDEVSRRGSRSSSTASGWPSGPTSTTTVSSTPRS